MTPPRGPMDDVRLVSFLDAVVIAGAMRGAIGYGVIGEYKVAGIFSVIGLGYLCVTLGIHFHLLKTQRRKADRLRGNAAGER